MFRRYECITFVAIAFINPAKVSAGVVIFVTLALGVVPGNTQAGIIGEHGRVRLLAARGSSLFGALYDREIIGDSFSEVLEASSGGNGIQGGRTKAFVGSNFDGTNTISEKFIRLSALAWTDMGGGFVPSGLAYSEGNWRDAIYLRDSVADSPNELLVEFNVTGQFVKQGNLDGGGTFGKMIFDVFTDTSVFAANSRARIDANFGISNSFNSATNFNSSSPAGARWSGGDTLQAQTGWDSIVFDGSPELEIQAFPNVANFWATKTVVLPYDTSVGGYDFQTWSVALAKVTGNTGFLDTDFLNSFGISQVSLADGTVLTDADIRFDSGFTLAAATQPVPEPSSLAIIICLFGSTIARRQRRLPKRSQ